MDIITIALCAAGGYAVTACIAIGALNCYFDHRDKNTGRHTPGEVGFWGGLFWPITLLAMLGWHVTDQGLKFLEFKEKESERGRHR